MIDVSRVSKSEHGRRMAEKLGYEVIDETWAIPKGWQNYLREYLDTAETFPSFDDLRLVLKDPE